MSCPMLSSTHSIFRGLQKTLKGKLTALQIVEGLTKYDQSPFYIWAALPDPRFNYKKL
ncbi:hypothetical protein DFH08DRAFT_970656 [Mycena albidolilacea]|uniref:Uncharacterized protein n=1 Tax=Mycena albidolilacea TaxID=1033008 RepID=A0AAD6ZFD6_9AGAR|nr:hypothetical protein DFH08DRAFT_970656 [Mycena albidolilacea]